MTRNNGRKSKTPKRNAMEKDEYYAQIEKKSYGTNNVQGPITPDLFVELMRGFYNLGWMVGSGGAMGCLANDSLIISPSGLQKERIRPTDLFIYDNSTRQQIQAPLERGITVSSCGVLFTLIMQKSEAECVIHTHSKYANLLTQICNEDCFEITDQEYIKGIVNPRTGKALANTDVLRIPIIDNKPSESLLHTPILETLNKYPETVAVLVRRHGLFVWGKTWEQAKIMLECIEYLLEIGFEMKKLHLS